MFVLSVLRNLGQDAYGECVRDMLQEEALRAEILARRTRLFLEEVC